MLMIAIPQADIPLLNGDGCNVRINGQATVINVKAIISVMERTAAKFLTNTMLVRMCSSVQHQMGMKTSSIMYCDPSNINKLKKKHVLRITHLKLTD